MAGLEGRTDGAGSAARFNRPGGVATDTGGNVYVIDAGKTIRKITPAGVVTRLAGSAGQSGIANGTGGDTLFNSAVGVATDSGGNIYVADRYLLNRITPAGLVTVLAHLVGNPGMATDSGGNVYVAAHSSNTIKKITPAGEVTTFAGSEGQSGSADGTGSAARFNQPFGLATDRGGNVYVADTNNHAIRKITPAGEVTTLAGLAGHFGSADGTGSVARFALPTGVATDSGGNVYVADMDNYIIRRITPAGVVTTLAGSARVSGSADGTVSVARFAYLAAVATDTSGNVYVADAKENHTIRKITPAGLVTTLAGSPGQSGSADGTGSVARFALPTGVATDRGANVYVADTSNDTIRKITPAGVVTTLAGSAGQSGSADGTGSAARFNSPWGVATDSGGNVYVADHVNNTIRKITPVGVVTTLAGSAGLNGSTDGTGSAARFAGPTGVATDGGGNVYVADHDNHAIRKITPAGEVTTLAGSAGHYGSADGTGSAARFDRPWGVATDGGANVYVADTSNTIRKITPAGVVTTLAGSARQSGSADGTGGAARFDAPLGIATDGGGNVNVADLSNSKIRIGRPALADTATIDSPTGTVGIKRQLNTSPQTARSWQWRIIRQPSGSAATLSSASVRNPRFTPDVADLFIFQLTASKGEKISITTVSLTATAAATAPIKP